MTDESFESLDVDSQEAGPVTEISQDPSLEKMIPASRVEELIKKTKFKTREKMQDELEMLRQENEKLKQSSMGGMMTPSIDAESLKRQVMDDLKMQFQAEREDLAKKQLEEQVHGIVNSYHSKMQTGKEMFEDFDEIMADFDPAAFPNLVLLTNQVDNTPEVMYELMKNPGKLGTVLVMSKEHPEGAKSIINRLSASIKANKQAQAQERNVSEPLSRLQSSPTGGASGEPTIKDFKRMFRG